LRITHTLGNNITLPLMDRRFQHITKKNQKRVSRELFIVSVVLNRNRVARNFCQESDFINGRFKAQIIVDQFKL
jgi:hypothetical protein